MKMEFGHLSLITNTFDRLFVLVLSETVLVLEWLIMTKPIFDHERLDVYPVAIDYVVLRGN